MDLGRGDGKPEGKRADAQAFPLCMAQIMKACRGLFDCSCVHHGTNSPPSIVALHPRADGRGTRLSHRRMSRVLYGCGAGAAVA